MAAAGLAMCLGVTKKETSAKFKASVRTTGRATQVIKNGSALLIDKVKDGSMSVSKAAKLTELPKRQQNEILRSDDPTKAIGQLAEANKTVDWQKTKAKMIATANVAMRLVDQLQDEKPCKNNINIQMMKLIQSFIEKGKTWK